MEEPFQNQPEFKGGPTYRKPLKAVGSGLGHLVFGICLVLCVASNAHHKEGQGGPSSGLGGPGTKASLHPVEVMKY